MDRDEQWQKIRPLYEAYGGEIAVLIIDVELKYGKFPTQVLNEIRALTTHVSRIAVENALTHEQTDKQIEKAARHIVRIKLDLYKYLCIWFRDEYQDRFPKKFKNVPIDTLIVGGEHFDIALSTRLTEAIELTRQAKKQEVASVADSSIPMYEGALSKFREIETLYQENERHLLSLKMKRRRDTITGWIIKGAVGVILKTAFDQREHIWSVIVSASSWVAGFFT